MTLKEKLKAIYRILFKNKPISTIQYGVRAIKCSDCKYYILYHPINCRCSVKPIDETQEKE